MSEPTEITVPSIGGAEEVIVAEILVAVGDEVATEQSLVILESDKASMEVPAPNGGVVTELHVAAGDTVAEGSRILSLNANTADADPDADAGRPSAPSARADTSATVPESAGAGPAGPAQPAASAPPVVTSEPAAVPRSAADLPYASPAIRRLARERRIDLRGVTGSGRNGRIIAADLDAPAASATPATAGALPPMPVIDFAQFGAIETERLTRINRLTGESVHRSWLHVPHVTQFDEADITDLDAFRKARKPEAEARGTKLTFVTFLLAASAAALREFPRFNSSLSADGSEVILKKYVNIGIAVDTPQGLVVPVVKDVANKRLFEIAEDLVDISTRAREGKLMPADFQGGTFTISSLGGIGGTAFTPIVNAPEVAILGASRSRMQPVWNGSEFVPRLMLPLSLSYDHRVIDGAAAARFTTRLGQMLTDIRDLLL
jgi:pyruvate dehydrogenase E2 component (dihydrolipoamide acetyltransferase)